MGWQQTTGRRRRASNSDPSDAENEEELVTYTFLPPGLSTPVPSSFGVNRSELANEAPQLFLEFDNAAMEDWTWETADVRTPMPGAPLLPSIAVFEDPWQ